MRLCEQRRQGSRRLLWKTCRQFHRNYSPRSSRAVGSGVAVRNTREVASTPAPFSDKFAQTAREEAARLATRAHELRSRGERWLARAEELLREADRLDHRVRELDELLGRSPQLRLDLQTTRLQGQRLRQEAARILLERRGLGVPIHYRDWFALLTESGLSVTGKDPLATFLTQITRSPIVVRVDKRSGVYALDPHGAYERARARLQATIADANAASTGSDGDSAAEMERARRALDAVLRARTTLFRDQLTRAAASRPR